VAREGNEACGWRRLNRRGEGATVPEDGWWRAAVGTALSPPPVAPGGLQREGWSHPRRTLECPTDDKEPGIKKVKNTQPCKASFKAIINLSFKGVAERR